MSRELVLDTSAYSAFMQGDRRLLHWIQGASLVFLPAIVLGELYDGFACGTRTRENEAALARVLEGPRTRVLATGPETARCYAAIVGFLRRAGTPVGVNYLWIAASTMEVGGELLTFDGDFLRIPQIRVKKLERLPIPG